MSRDINKLCITAPFFRNYFFLRKIRLNPLRIGVFFINLVHCHNNGHVRRPGVIDGFCSLWHHAVIRSHNQHDDIGTGCTAGAHLGKRCVTGGVQEGNHAVAGFHMVGTYMLGDATGFACCHPGAPNMIQQ